VRRLLGLATAGLLLVTVGACTDDGEVPPAGTAPSVAPAGSTGAVQAPAETRTVDAAGDIISMSVTPLVRAGGAVVLTVQTRLDRSGRGGASVLSRHFSNLISNSFDAVRLVDEAGRRVYLVSEQQDGSGCVCTGLTRFEVGETRPLQAVFAGVPAGVDRLSVMLPYAGVFTDVPVVDGVVPVPPTGKTRAGDGQEPLDPASAAPAFSGVLDSYTERLDVALRTRRSADEVDISLDTDVLFRLDQADLTPAAGKSIAAAVADLRAAGAGPLTVTGHTDSTGSTAHNQELSQRRAEAVAGALRKSLPDSEWPKTIAAKGESAPAVPNGSDAQRALNRRVAITYRARAGQATAPTKTKTVLPKTKGKQGRAPDGVEVAMPLNRGTIRFIPGQATVRGPFLLVSLTARNAGDNDATILDFLGQGVFTVRNEFDPYARYGTAGVRLLQGDTASYGLDYERDRDDHRCLCDRILSIAIPPGSERVLSLWFPAPPAGTGTGTVTLDVPDRMRITDIPLT
jgi:outer membrane protein OmpA-like peptidoglycan-associated protein